MYLHAVAITTVKRRVDENKVANKVHNKDLLKHRLVERETGDFGTSSEKFPTYCDCM